MPTAPDTTRFSSLKSFAYYIKKVTGETGIGPRLSKIIDLLEPGKIHTSKDLYVPEQSIKPGLPTIVNVSHWHQPLGNVAKGIYKGIKRLMDVLYEYYLMQLEVWESFVKNNPAIGYIETVHLTGTLVTWMAQEHPDWIARFSRLVRGTVTGNPGEKPHMELFASPYFESLASTMPVEEAVRQTKLSIEVMNSFGMKPSGYWLVERIWEPGYFHIFTKELRKLGINKAAIDDHLFYKMTPEEIHASGFDQESFSEIDLRGYFILDDELKKTDPFYILPANRDYRQARPYWLSEIPRKGGRFIPYWLRGYLQGSVSKERVTGLFKNNTSLLETFFITHPLYTFRDKTLDYLVFKDNCPALIHKADDAILNREEKAQLKALWEETQKEKYTGTQCLIWAGDGEKPTNLWRYMGDAQKHKEYLEQARTWLTGELETKLSGLYANYLPTDQLLERTECRGYIRLPFGAYKEMTWWALTTDDQLTLQRHMNIIDRLKTVLLDYQGIAEILNDEVLSAEDLLTFEKLSNTEISKYNILLEALRSRNRLTHCKSFYAHHLFLSPGETKELQTLEKGTPWKNFWLKYDESYKYHRQWLFLYNLATEQIEDESTKNLILNLLGRATVNCGSWHGVFGGRYLANLRNDMMWGIAAAAGIYIHGLEQQGSFKKGDIHMHNFDFSHSLADELKEAEITISPTAPKGTVDIVMFTYQMMVIVSPRDGGAIYDWIYFNTGNPQSVINTINLIKEPYHDAAAAMVAWFKEKIGIFKELIEEASPWLSEWQKEQLLKVRAHEHGQLYDAGKTGIEHIDYPAFQDKISSLASIIKEIAEKKPEQIKIIALYDELQKRPVFEGTKTLTKPIQNLNVVNALRNYDTRLPVNHITRVRDMETTNEIGDFSTAVFTLMNTKEENDIFRIVMQRKSDQITMIKTIIISKNSPTITVEYQIIAPPHDHKLELEIENNTNISYIDNSERYFQVNDNTINISGKTEALDVRSLTIVNHHENCAQNITISPNNNRLILRPRYSASQGLRMFETTLQYVRYTFFIPVTGTGKNPFTLTLSHSLDPCLKEEEENSWIMNQY